MHSLLLRDFYPRPLRGGRPHRHILSGDTSNISIHALCEEGDSETIKPTLCYLIFLSTPSARRATWAQQSTGCTERYFYPRPLRGGRRGLAFRRFWGVENFYPRPLRGGRL